MSARAKGLPRGAGKALLGFVAMPTILRPLVVSALFASVGVRAADATSPVDAAQRNQAFAPQGSVTPSVQAPARAAGLQDKVIDKRELDKKTADGVAGRRAPVEVGETREKKLVTPEVRPAQPEPRRMSPLDHRPANLSTGGDTVRPPAVAKYQDSLAAASTTNMARFPADGAATTGKINRFVFRKNGADGAPVTAGAAVTPAGAKPND